VKFLQRLNEALHRDHPATLTIAEESTAWPSVTGPEHTGGLGFDLKWDMGWMHDTLRYMSRDSVHRKHHHAELTFRRVYAYAERYLLPLSHDEVVYGKGSLLGRMPGDAWQKLANLRLLYAYLFATPGKKLLFMGAELAQLAEWNHDSSLDWHLEGQPAAQGISRLLTELHRVYRGEPALHLLDHDPEGFDWIEANDTERSVLSFLRRSGEPGRSVAAVFNLTPAVHRNFRLGVPDEGSWQELINSDATEFGGSGQGNLGVVEAMPVPAHGRPFSLNLTLPPLGALLLSRA
jgi:1,4-alpha-glucan branching enzyme